MTKQMKIAHRRSETSNRRAKAIEKIHYRLMIVMLILVGVFGVIVMKLVWMRVFDSSSSQSNGSIGFHTRRDIVDRNGLLLATTIRSWIITVQPRKLVNDPAYVADRLAALIPGRSVSEYMAILRSNKPFAYLERNAPPEVVAAVNAIGEPAIQLSRGPVRLYPQATLAAHILGWVDEQGRGVSGVERVLDKELKDSSGNVGPVSLTIDARVQSAVEHELAGAVRKFTALSGCATVLDVRNGDVLAMASYPTFNPNNPGLADMASLMNHSTQSVYELGSTFKAITIANAIDSGVVGSMAKKYDATAPLHVGRFTIHDEEPAGRWLNVPEMMVRSSNIVTSRIADELGRAKEESMFKRLGLGGAPEVDLPARAKPIWPTYWGRTTTMTVAYGHGIAITPLNLAIAYAALVNGGVYQPAKLVKRREISPSGRRVISESTSARVRQLLRLVVLPAAGGTGRKADVPGFRLGGKTGTAAKAELGGYAKKVNVSTFAGVFPMDDPRYVIIMTLDGPHGTADTFGLTTAGWTVAPSIGRILPRIGPMLGVVPDVHHDIDESDLLPLILHPANHKGPELRNVE